MKDQLLAHFEKGILVLCMGLMGWFVYEAFSLQPYQKTPQQFSDVAKAARKNVSQTKVKEEDLATPDLKGVAKTLASDIDWQPYAFRFEWRRPFDYGLSFRKEPVVLKPTKPIVQDNRGWFGVYETDLRTGKLAKTKTKKSDAKHEVVQGKDDAFSTLVSQAGGFGLGKKPAAAAVAAPAPPENPEVVNKNQKMGFTGGAMNVSEIFFDGNQGVSKAVTGEKVVLVPPVAEKNNVTQAPIATTGSQGGRRMVVGEAEEKPKEKEEEAKKDEWTESYIVGMRGKHFVEILSTFPHADQIREYVKALREPASFVGLRYALAEVQRRELTSSHEWSEWTQIPLREQLDVILNSAFGFEPEMYPKVAIKGLAMNIPYLWSFYKKFLTLPELENPKAAVYSPEEMNPQMTIGKPKPARKRKTPKEGVAPAAPGAPPNRVLAKDIRVENLFLDKKADEKKGDGKPGEASKTVAASSKDFDNRHEVETAMIRFWDFTVEPGKRYQYRVRCVTYNPNFIRTDVADAGIASEKYLYGPWSDPSDEVYVEPDAQWYVREKDRADQRVELEVHHWSPKAGEWLVNTFKQRPGDIIGITSASKTNVIRKFDQETNQLVREEMRIGKDFDAGAILLDVWGGREGIWGVKERTGKSRVLPIPIEAVAVNAQGDLVRHQADEDAANKSRERIAESYNDLVQKLGKGETKNGDEAPEPEPAPTKKSRTKSR